MVDVPNAGSWLQVLEPARGKLKEQEYSNPSIRITIQELCRHLHDCDNKEIRFITFYDMVRVITFLCRPRFALNKPFSVLQA